MGTSPFIARRRRAMQAAAELLDQLDIDQEQPVDVFDAIGRLGMWLVFQRLRSLLGAVVAQGSGGVMITTEREPAIQRYTAAHEIGHWRLDYNPTAFDTETDVFNPGANERERVAQWFASYFLMPPPLVHTTVARHLSTGTTMSPATAYLIARDMQVSYEAALRQMANLDILIDRERDNLLAIPRLKAKQDAAQGHRPQDGYADVWLVDERSLERTVEQVDVVVHDEIVVALPENRTTGYRWLGEAARAGRANLRARPAPPPFTPPATAAAARTRPPQPHPPQRTTADITAALALLPQHAHTQQGNATDTAGAGTSPTTTDQSPDGLQIVLDEYRPGWALIGPRDIRKLREHIAGRPSEPTKFPAPAAGEGATTPGQPSRQPDPPNLGVGATGRRLLVLQARVEGQFRHVLHYAPIHEPHTLPAATFTISANVIPPPAVLHRRALLEVDLDDAGDQSSPAE